MDAQCVLHILLARCLACFFHSSKSCTECTQVVNLQNDSASKPDWRLNKRKSKILSNHLKSCAECSQVGNSHQSRIGGWIFDPVIKSGEMETNTGNIWRDIYTENIWRYICTGNIWRYISTGNIWRYICTRNKTIFATSLSRWRCTRAVLIPELE